MTHLTRLLALAVATGALLVPSTPARADTAVTGATLTWGLNGYAQKGVFGPWSFKDLKGHVTELVGSVSGGTQTEYAAAPLPATSMPVSSPQKTPNAVKFVLGTGTRTEDGDLDLAWTGSYVVNAYPAQYNAPNETYADPELHLAADGSGSLTMHFSLGAGQDIDGHPTPAVDLGRRTLLTFSDGAATSTSADSYRAVPDYQGVHVTPPADETAQDTSCSGTWGSWDPDFVTALPSSVRAHFYSTGCGGSQDTKPALPVDVDLGTSGQSATALTLSAPTRTYGQAASVVVSAPSGSTGTVSLRSGSTELGQATLSGGKATFALGKPAVRSYPLTATYFGSATAAPAEKAGTLTVGKASSTTSSTITTKPTPKKGGKATLKVTSPTTTPTGRVKVVVTRGSKKLKTLNPTLAKGTATVGLPKLAKGSYRLTTTYAGTGNVAGSSRAATFTVR